MRKFTVNVNGTKYEVEVEEFVQGSKVSENKTASEPLKASAPSKPAASAPGCWRQGEHYVANAGHNSRRARKEQEIMCVPEMFCWCWKL